ncbi:hypothetical protein JW960_03115 [candidate division KSB1 bacterium]|nr:hypothetical protein [candidate division KSB1 bacterium]
MKTKYIISFCTLLLLSVLIIQVSAKSGTDLLSESFDLTGARSSETQYYQMESKLISIGLDGSQQGTDIFRLKLKWQSAVADKPETCTCLEFTIQLAGTDEVAIPSLTDWSYPIEPGYDEHSQVFGIDHSKFDGLTDANGTPIPPDKTYHIYNAFIDFQSFCYTFAEPTTAGKGVQDLTRIGQKIVHAAAFTEPPVNLGSNVAEGSTYKNGEITLELKGLSLVNNKACALIAFDSGQSSYKMKMQPMPNMEINTAGSSHYFGDIYKALDTNWVQRVTLGEIVVSETTLPMPPNKINSVIERKIVIQNVAEKTLWDQEKM